MTEQKRWLMSIIYRTDNGPVVVDYEIEELDEIADIVERGPDWNAILDISVQLMNVREEGLSLQVPIQTIRGSND